MRRADPARVISWIAAVVAAIVAITLPLGYWTVAYNSLAMGLALEAEVRASLISDFIVHEQTQIPVAEGTEKRPPPKPDRDAWKSRNHQLEEHLLRVPQVRDGQRNRIFDTSQALVKEAPENYVPPGPTKIVAANISGAFGPAGRVELEYSLRGIILRTALVGLFALLLAAAVFIALRVMPLRALTRATRALEEEVRQHQDARASAEAANRAKSQFLAAASHDLRQPMHALGLFAASLSEKARDPATRSIVESISGSVEALEVLFNELLDVSKLDAGVIQPNLTTFPLQTVFDRLWIDHEPEARENGIRLRIVPTTARVYSDPVLLERMLRNLLGNAIRYTNEGAVLLACRRRADTYVLELRDSGIGIPADKLERVFDEFYQVGNPERDRRKGLGLGLAIVRRIEQLLGYRVEVFSAVGKGTTFRFSVPRARAESLAREMPAPPAPTHALRGRLIVVVDDEQAVRDGMKALLGGWGCTVLAADSLPDAMERIAEIERKPDLIIADYRLRGHTTGIDVIRALHEEFGADMPALLVTGDTAAERLREVRQSGYPQLHKPVSPATLRVTLTRMLGDASAGALVQEPARLA